ncbi:MAG: 7-cyano-7-deazaguanine synthase [Thermoplasmata archaeon]
MTGMVRALVLLSGGLDSAVSFYWALREGWSVYPLTFHYHERPQREKDATVSLVRRSGCQENLLEVGLPFLMELEDLRENGLDNLSLRDAPGAYVPARNLIFYATAAHYGEILGAQWLVGGHNGADGEIFPDATPEFFGGLNRLLKMGLLATSKSHLQIVNPLESRTKADVLRLGQELGVPFEVTWSCHYDRAAPCGTCASCRERGEAFQRLGTEDPLLAASAAEG